MKETSRPPRPPLGERLVAAMQRTQEWVVEGTPARVTLYDENGQRTEPKMMMLQEVEAWQKARLPKETYTLIEELSFWAGRNIASDEDAAKVETLRQQAATLLQARQTATVA